MVQHGASGVVPESIDKHILDGDLFDMDWQDRENKELMDCFFAAEILCSPTRHCIGFGWKVICP